MEERKEENKRTKAGSPGCMLTLSKAKKGGGGGERKEELLLRKKAERGKGGIEKGKGRWSETR